MKNVIIMNEFDMINIIKREKLDEKNYFSSLIREAFENLMITEDEIVDLQIQIIQLLDEIVYKYNGMDSSSIRKELMEDINSSNYFTIGLQLKTYRNPDEALKELLSKGIKELYYNGRKRIDRFLNIIRLMYIKVKQSQLEISNDIYNDTINGGIQGFLKIYDPDFKAQDMKITADYPLYNNLVGKLEGVEFINKYVNSIYLENKFCNKFKKERIENLLYGYSHNYKELIINIFEIVFLEVIACKLVKRDIYELTISEFELNTIYLIFKDKRKNEIKNIIYKIYSEICEEIVENNKELQKYIEKNIDEIVDIIENGVNQRTLNKVFIVDKFIEI